jgi:hypothetical protein
LGKHARQKVVKSFGSERSARLLRDLLERTCSEPSP